MYGCGSVHTLLYCHVQRPGTQTDGACQLSLSNWAAFTQSHTFKKHPLCNYKASGQTPSHADTNTYKGSLFSLLFTSNQRKTSQAIVSSTYKSKNNSTTIHLHLCHHYLNCMIGYVKKCLSELCVWVVMLFCLLPVFPDTRGLYFDITLHCENSLFVFHLRLSLALLICLHVGSLSCLLSRASRVYWIWNIGLTVHIMVKY